MIDFTTTNDGNLLCIVPESNKLNAKQLANLKLKLQRELNNPTIKINVRKPFCNTKFLKN